MKRRVLYYVSGHGYGHSTRSAEVARCLASAGIDVETRGLGSGAIEAGNALRVDEKATLEAVSRDFAAPTVADEAALIRQRGVDLVVADIPFLAGDIAEAVRAPCIAIGNFTWDWIYEPYFQQWPEYAHLAPRVRGGYRKMRAWLRLPFSHDTDVFPMVRDVPLIARSGNAPVRTNRILVAMRGGVRAESLARARDAGRFEFIEPWGHFPDLLRSSAAVISKLGYNTLAECVANDCALLYPPRAGFREEEILRQAATRYLRSRPIPLDDFESGNWTPHIEALLAQPAPAGTLAIDGAEVCARYILDNL